ncbi:hypothetical protein [Photobacterium kasasachensis]|uniref:hypothetical protein n=1 Tax=Photobacterium kasasachensis TaxID=2910240 RepID=UPI003D0A766B
MAEKELSISEENYRAWDVVIKCIGILGAIVSFVWGVYQYVETQAEVVKVEQIARDRAFAQELFKRRVDEYQNIAIAAGKLSAPSSQPEELEKDIRSFERLYWSSLATLRSDEVVRAMDYLRSGIENYQSGRSMLGDKKPEDQLKVRARELSRALRRAIEQERVNLALSPMMENPQLENSK